MSKVPQYAVEPQGGAVEGLLGQGQRQDDARGEAVNRGGDGSVAQGRRGEGQEAPVNTQADFCSLPPPAARFGCIRCCLLPTPFSPLGGGPPVLKESKGTQAEPCPYRSLSLSNAGRQARSRSAPPRILTSLTCARCWAIRTRRRRTKPERASPSRSGFPRRRAARALRT